MVNMSNRIGIKRQKLLSRKEELLKELQYYERRLEDARSSRNSSGFYEDDSSDSEMEFTINRDTSLTELKLEKSQLQTCLRATEELTNVSVIQSEVIVLVDQPNLDHEPPVSEAGVWREVIAECKVDLVSFSISFYTHQPSREFGAAQYRALHVACAKRAHELELQRSVLPTLRTPSDAIEVLHCYARAARCRRATLARLAERYADALFMEPGTEGGYSLQCAGLLRVRWSLQNKWSPVAPFLHKMIFDLEHMDETYINVVKEAYEELRDPTLDTDDRTVLLAKIIDTCLEARKTMGPAADSDVDSHRHTSDQELEVPTQSSQIMGPPKSLPKKTKPKGKENIATSSRKRGSDANGECSHPKKTKNDNCKDKTVKNTQQLKATEKNCNDNEQNGNQEIMVSENTGETSNVNTNGREGVNTEHVDININANTKTAHCVNTSKDSKKTIESDRSNQKTKNIQKSNFSDILKNSDTIKSKDNTQVKKIAKSKSDTLKSVPTKNLPEKELILTEKTSGKLASKNMSPEGESINVHRKNVDDKPETQNKNLNSKLNSNNLNINANFDKNGSISKKSKTSVANINKNAENSESNQNKYSTSNTNKKSNNKIVKEKAVKEKNIPRTDTNVANQLAMKANIEKNLKKNLLLGKKPVKQQTNEKVNKISVDNQTSKINSETLSKETFKNPSNANSNHNLVVKTNNVQTLSERFNNREKTGVKTTNVTNDCRIGATKNTVNNNENKIEKPTINGNSNKDIGKSNKNSPKTISNKKNNKLQSSDTILEKKIKEPKKKLNMKTQSKINSNNIAKVGKTPSLKKALPKNNVFAGNEQITKIPQKRLSMAKNPVRSTPRKHLLKLSTTRDSSKSSATSVHTQTHIPRLLKKPTAKAN